MILRAAREEDKQYFWQLRNDPVALRASRSPSCLWIEHVAWWARTGEARWVAVDEYKLARVGILRLGADGTVHIVVDPQYRGKGYGTQMLEALVPLARGLGFTRIWAEIAPENVASQRIFLKTGWAPILMEKVV